MWPSRWFTPMNGTSRANATAFAAASPTSSAPTRPGPTVTATASTSPNQIPASVRASVSSGLTFSRWAREAISGTTPPNRSCRWAWLDSRFDRIFRPSSTTATAVSSQEVSIPRTRIPALGLAEDAAGQIAHDGGEPAPVAGRSNLVGPHHQGVLPGLLVVALPDPDGPEAEPSVQALRTRVRHTHLQRHRAGTHADALAHQLEQEAGADLPPVMGRVHGDRGDVGLVAVGHHASVADHVPADPGHQVGPVAHVGHLREEQVRAPRTGVDLALDRHHAADVAPAHPGDLELRRLVDAGPKRSPHPTSSSRWAAGRTPGRTPRAGTEGRPAPPGPPRRERHAPPRRSPRGSRPPRAPDGTPALRSPPPGPPGPGPGSWPWRCRPASR